MHREDYIIDAERTYPRAGCQPTRYQSPPGPDTANPGQSPHLCQIVHMQTIYCTVVQGGHLFWYNRFRNPNDVNLLMQKSLPRQGLLSPISVAGTFVHTAPALLVRVGFGVTSWRYLHEQITWA